LVNSRTVFRTVSSEGEGVELMEMIQVGRVHAYIYMRTLLVRRKGNGSGVYSN
jgi:hypothetical protein